MGVYFTFIGFMFVAACFEAFQVDSNKLGLKKTVLFLTYLFSIIIVGLRWETGTDWHPYLALFKQSSTLTQNYIGTVEIGYLLVNWLCYHISHSYSFFLLVHAAIFYYMIIYGLNKISPYPITSYLFFFCSTMGVIGSNRQLLALCIVFYFIIWAYEKKRSFFLVVLGAMMFHTTALLTSSFYFFNRRIKTIYLLGIIVFAGLIGLTEIPGKLFSLAGGISEAAAYRAEVYSAGGGGKSELSAFGIVRRILYVLLFIFIRKKIEIKYPFYNFLLNGYIMSTLIYLMFSSSLVILVNRGSLYFNMLECILFSSILIILDRPDSKLLFLIGLLGISVIGLYQSISGYPDLFDPYKGLWYNYNYFRRMY